MNKTNHVLTGLRASVEKQKAEKLQRIDKLVKNVLVKYPKGFTVKDIVIDTNGTRGTANVIRRYMADLVEDGRVQIIGKDGKSVIYILSDFLTDKQEQEAKKNWLSRKRQLRRSLRRSAPVVSSRIPDALPVL